LIIDLTTEMAAQLVYTLAGIALLAASIAHVGAARAVFTTTVMAFVLGGAILGAFVAFQGRSVDLLAHLSRRWLKDSRARADAVRSALAAVYGQPARLAASFGLHALSWVASGLCSWLALMLMGAHLAPWQVLALESLLSAVRSVAFMTPGGLGIQEGAYVVVAPLFGLPPETALALSLMKRAKDILIGAPALLIWQAQEGRKLVQNA
jgi:putative membrane protein